MSPAPLPARAQRIRQRGPPSDRAAAWLRALCRMFLEIGETIRVNAGRSLYIYYIYIYIYICVCVYLSISISINLLI